MSMIGGEIEGLFWECKSYFYVIISNEVEKKKRREGGFLKKNKKEIFIEKWALVYNSRDQRPSTLQPMNK